MRHRRSRMGSHVAKGHAFVLDAYDRVIAAMVGRKAVRRTSAFDDVVNDANGVEVAIPVQTEEAFGSRGHSRTRDDVVVANDQNFVTY